MIIGGGLDPATAVAPAAAVAPATAVAPVTAMVPVTVLVVAPAIAVASAIIPTITVSPAIVPAVVPGTVEAPVTGNTDDGWLLWNDRQLATFMHKFSQSGGLLQLCLTVEQISVTVEQAETTSNPFVSHSVPNAQAETTSNLFASHSASTTQPRLTSRIIEACVSETSSILDQQYSSSAFSTGLSDADSLFIGKFFKDKDEMVFTLRMFAVKHSFEFHTVKSDLMRLGEFKNMQQNLRGVYLMIVLRFYRGGSTGGYKLMRKVISIDGAHLTSKFKGTLLGASAQDGNFNLYPIAFAIVDSENDASWDWFLKCLLNIIPDENDLVFVSDRAASIASGLSGNYPLAHHGLCTFHLQKNLETHFIGSSLIPVYYAASRVYTKTEFDSLFWEITNSDKKLAQYLWENREYPIVCLFESIRSIMTRWFNERREESSQHPSAVTINVGKKMNASYDTSTRWLEVCQVNQEEFEVKGDTKTHLVNLDKRTCTCCMFDIDKFPCAHGIASAKHINLNENMFVDEFHSTYRWRQAYSESIHPNGDMEYWEIPETISEVICLPPSTRVPSGRRKKKRIPSVWEHGRSQPKPKLHKCSRCGQSGHNKSTCVAAI
ncbi:Zinc finger PMZ-type [Arabidopsis thaliana x Arabidopsis arenosa]|nr:Zinc finger PMZ-type [Arabidopsis thaliana x Arabidopsis arenosa]